MNVLPTEGGKTPIEETFDDVQSDIFSLFGQQGTVINGFIVRTHQASIGGLLFPYKNIMNLFKNIIS